jgi:hypothetical protein
VDVDYFQRPNKIDPDKAERVKYFTPLNTIKLREYMCISGTDALASTSVWVKLKASLPRAKILKLMAMSPQHH